MEETLTNRIKVMHQIEIADAKKQVESLLQAALDGDEVIITQNSEPVLRLVRVNQPKKRRQSGTAKGLIKMSDDFDEPLEDFRDYMQ
jgi:prevent-host-death family protein